MVIDFHTHVFPDKIAPATISALESKSGLTAATDGTVNGLLASMEASGVDCSIIMPVVTAPRQFESINRFANEINIQFGEPLKDGVPRLISFGGIHPDTDNYKEQLQQLKAWGFKGIKLHPDYQGVNFDDIRCERIVSYATELDMIVLTHAGVDIGIPEPVRCTPSMAAKVLKDTQTKNLVLAHFGGWSLWDEVEELLVGSDAYFDISFIYSYINKEQFCRVVKNHGSDKILFGSDSPWGKQNETITWLQKSELSENIKMNIFSDNARRILKL